MSAAHAPLKGYRSFGPKPEKSCIDISEDVDMARVAVPAKAGRLDGSRFMAPERARVFRDLSCIILPDEEIPAIGTRSAHKLPASSEAAFVRKLISCDMACFVE